MAIPPQPRKTRSVPYRDLVQRVRRYRPSDLLPALGQVSADYLKPDMESAREIPAHILSALARDALLFGNEDRSRQRLSRDEVLGLVNLFNTTYDREPGADAHAVMTRHAFEQFRFQEYELAGMARTLLVLDHVLANPVTRFNHADFARWLGGAAEQVFRAQQILATLVSHEKGYWRPRDESDLWKLAADEQPLLDMFTATPPGVVLAVADRMTVTQAQFKECYPLDRRETSPWMQRWLPNPLQAFPLIRLPDGSVVAPQLREILRSGTLDVQLPLIPPERRDEYLRELGDAVERYVGDLLRDIEDATIEPAIRYGPNGEESIDWIVTLAHLVILIEVKAVRPNLNVKMAQGEYEATYLERITRGARQIKRTNTLIETQHPAFAHLANDKPRIGIIVTGEPFYLPNRPWSLDQQQGADIPILLGSLLDVERLSGHTADEITHALTTVAGDPEQSTWYLGSAMHHHLPAKTRVGKHVQTVIDTRLSVIDVE